MKKAEKTITICGQEVKMLYCAASETGYEVISGKSSDIFSSKVAERDKAGKPTKIDPPAAMMDDYIKLAISSIVAAYDRDDQEAPVSAKEIMYEATPEEITNLIQAVIALRLEWYKIPSVVKPETEETEDSEKNA